ncbi:DUF6221 family protein [Streptomyces prunicolor]|uniref:DUF6221 family protein n=1 Tax=Streptomyces prunicolor TaxID=67348 RepID=UPI003722EB68
MDDLVRWLGVQLDEDERIARATRITSITARVYFNDTKALSWDGDHESLSTDGMFAPLADHIAEHDPARVLREIDAKRQLLAAYSRGAPNDVIDVKYARGYTNALNEAVRLLALPYADRPGYAEALASAQ